MANFSSVFSPFFAQIKYGESSIVHGVHTRGQVRKWERSNPRNEHVFLAGKSANIGTISWSINHEILKCQQLNLEIGTISGQIDLIIYYIM